MIDYFAKDEIWLLDMTKTHNFAQNICEKFQQICDFFTNFCANFCDKKTVVHCKYYYNLVPAIINKKKAFSCVADSGKTVIVFVDLIVDHEQ